MSQIFSVNQVIGKTLYLNPGKSCYTYSKIYPSLVQKNYYTNKALVGVVEGYTQISGKLYWLLGDMSFVIHEPGLFNAKLLKDQGAETTQQERERKEREERERKEREENINKPFGDKALDMVKNITLFSLGAWLIYTFITKPKK
jgi:hypothetical protein